MSIWDKAATATVAAKVAANVVTGQTDGLPEQGLHVEQARIEEAVQQQVPPAPITVQEPPTP